MRDHVLNDPSNEAVNPDIERSGVLNPDGSMAKTDLLKLFEEIRFQPPWRLQADIDADFYDGNQHTEETLADMEAKGIAPMVVNLIKPCVDVVLGMEAKTRTDWIVRCEDNEALDDLAEALSAKLHGAERESKADRACADAYAAQVKTGLGWVEVAKECDPFKPRYRVDYVHRREIDWDWRATKHDLSDARYLVRRKWYDQDIAQAYFPEHRDLIGWTMADWDGWNALRVEDTFLAQSLEIERASSLEAAEWKDYARKRVCIFEVWYRTIEEAYFLTLPSGRVIEFDLKNDDHCQAVISGKITPEKKFVTRMRQSYWVGPHRLIDRPSPYKHQHFPYVPFFGFREDRTGVPYGLVRTMRSSQDEVNARRAKMMWLLSSRRVITDADAVLDHAATADEVARADAYIIKNPERRATSDFKVEDGGSMAKDQFMVMQDAADNIQKTAGVYQTMLGETGGATSGRAIDSLIEQGITTLGEINDNYRDARTAVGNLLLDLIKEDIGRQPTDVRVGEGKRAKITTLNKPGMNEHGQQVLENDVSRAMSKVVLDSISSSPTFRQQQMTHLMEMTKSLPEQVQALIIDFVIEASDMPKKQEIAERIRKSLNIPDSDDEAQQMPTAREQELEMALQQTQEQAQALMAEAQKQVEDAKNFADQQVQKNKDTEREIEAMRLESKREERVIKMDENSVKRDEQALRREELALEIELKRKEFAAGQGENAQQHGAPAVESAATSSSMEVLAAATATLQAAMREVLDNQAEATGLVGEAITKSAEGNAMVAQRLEKLIARLAASQEALQKPKTRTVNISRDSKGVMTGAEVVEMSGQQ